MASGASFRTILENMNKKENNNQSGLWTWFGPMTFRDSIMHFDSIQIASGASFRTILENKNKKENNNQSGLRTWFGPITFRDSIMHFDKHAKSFLNQVQDDFQH